MTKITFTIGIVNHLRTQKTPPLARYCCLLSLAETRQPMTANQIFRRFGLGAPLAGSLDSAVRQGFIDEIPNQSPKLYQITTKGEALVTQLLNSATEIIPAA